MHSLVSNELASDALAAHANRSALGRANILALDFTGGPGCGKTSLITATMQRLIPSVRIGLIIADPDTHDPIENLARLSGQIVEADTGAERFLRPAHLHKAIGRLNLDRLDLLLIENISSYVPPARLDGGWTKTIVVFSAAAGDHKAAKYPDLISAACAVVLNKIDLVPSVGFDMHTFRANVRRINPNVPFFPLSLLCGEGVDDWIDWVRQQVAAGPSNHQQLDRKNA